MSALVTLLAQLAGLGAAGVVLYAGWLLKRAIRPARYDWPVWVYRLRLEYRAWRAVRRQRRDEREAERRGKRLLDQGELRPLALTRARRGPLD